MECVELIFINLYSFNFISYVAAVQN